MANGKNVCNVQIPRDLYKQMEEIAARNGISTSGVVTLVCYGLARYKRENADSFLAGLEQGRAAKSGAKVTRKRPPVVDQVVGPHIAWMPAQPTRID